MVQQGSIQQPAPPRVPHSAASLIADGSCLCKHSINNAMLQEFMPIIGHRNASCLPTLSCLCCIIVKGSSNGAASAPWTEAVEGGNTFTAAHFHIYRFSSCRIDCIILK